MFRASKVVRYTRFSCFLSILLIFQMLRVESRFRLVGTGKKRLLRMNQKLDRRLETRLQGLLERAGPDL